MPHREFLDPDLAQILLPFAFDPATGDGAHDLGHLLRVWRNAVRIARVEGGLGPVLTAAVILHDCVQVEKNSPRRAAASQLAAERASDILTGLGWDAGTIGQVRHAIAAHSFSAGLQPGSLVARILQDADRLDAIGLIGVARCFYVAGRMGAAIHHPADPQAQQRPLDDSHYALDHFQTKLLKLYENFQTPTGRKLAGERQAAMQAYLTGLLAEIE